MFSRHNSRHIVKTEEALELNSFQSLHCHKCRAAKHAKIYFTLTAEIQARSLANFYCQYADRHMNLKFTRRVRQRARAGNSTICYRKKQIDVSF